MNIKRSLCCLFAVFCCLPILSTIAQDATPLVPPVATLIDPVVTVLPGQATDVAATAVPGGTEPTAISGDAGAIPTNDSGAIGEATAESSDPMATTDANMMSTTEPGMMGTMEVMMTPDDPNSRTIGDIIAFQADLNVPEFTILRQALEDTGLLETLMDENMNYILFAPTDAALMALPEDTMATLMSDPQRLRLLLLNHVVPAHLFTDDMSMMGTAEPGMMATDDMMATEDMMATMEPGMMATEDMMATMEPRMMATDDMSMDMEHCMTDMMQPNMMATDDMSMTGTMEPGMMATEDMMATTEAMPMATMDATMEPGMMATEDMMGTMEPGMMATDDMMMGTMEPDMMGDDMMWSLPSLGGLSLSIEYHNGCMTVNDIPVTNKINASNGRIYVIEGVLMPEEGVDMMGTMEPGMMATEDMMMGTAEPGMMATEDMMATTEAMPMATMDATMEMTQQP